MSDEIQKSTEAPVRRKPGRPAKAKPPQIDIDASVDEDGGEEVLQRAATRTQTRVSARTLSNGRLEVTGRDGEALSRTRTYVGDIFEIPLDMIEPGWSMQWNAVSIAGNSEIILDQNHMMHQNGWRPVPAERFAGTLVPKGATGPIIRGQQMLMERPQSLTDEARAEDLRNAKQLVSDQNEALKLTKVKDQLPDGMAMSNRYKGTGGGVKLQIDKSLDVLDINRQAGNYKLDK